MSDKKAELANPQSIHGRVHERAQLEVAVNMETDHNFYAGITDNISEGGLFVATNVPPPKGSVIEMALSLPGYDTPFQIKGTVCWIRDNRAATLDAPAGCGVRWSELAPEVLRAITQFIKRRETILFDSDY